MNIKWKKLPSKSTPQIRAYEEAVQRGMKNQHVLKSDGGWAVRSGGSARASKVFPTQDKATGYAEKIAKTKKSDVIVHGENGRIKERHSYAH